MSNKRRHSMEESEEQDEIITFSVGCKKFPVCKSTILKYPETTLAKMITRSEDMKPAKQLPDKSYLVEMSPSRFQHILDFYYYGELWHMPDLGITLPSECEMWVQDLQMMNILEDKAHTDAYMQGPLLTRTQGDFQFGEFLRKDIATICAGLMELFIGSGEWNEMKKSYYMKFTWIFKEQCEYKIGEKLVDIFELFASKSAAEYARDHFQTNNEVTSFSMRDYVDITFLKTNRANWEPKPDNDKSSGAQTSFITFEFEV